MKSLLEVLIGLCSAAIVVYVFAAMGSDFAQAKGIQPDGSSENYRMWQAEVEAECYNLSIKGYTIAAAEGDTKEEALAFAKWVNWRCLSDTHLAF